ncbi:hypothetical protein J1C56_02115 [Aminobacter anthyllidis]|uniref:Uncharacterized protein n=1 Tax=Aminobacter anthyllidis TaxID=1035067 RepID=A0A9X1D0Z9_9HYPH|nr:hypothetical protein [Aminobacter anthyllidis]MBT1154380.1 hypothetical protein [Aminobacter anthyllidis]
MANTTTSTGSIPDYIANPTKNALGSVESFLKSPDNYVYGSKPGETLYTPLSQGQNKAIGNVNWLADQNLAELFGTNKAGGMLDEFAAYKPDQLSAEKLTDEGGYLGSIDGYMNPYLRQILDPQIREIGDGLQRGRRDLGANASMSGAFGDARHGIVETGLYDDAAENAADITGRTYSDAWNNAMQMRSGDMATKLGVDTSNRDAETLANENKATAASGIAGLGQQYFKNFTDVNDALFNAGQVEREASQEQNDALRSFQEAIKNKKYDDALKLLGAVQGSPYPTSSTSKTKSDDGLFGLLGSAVGSLF